MKPGKYWAIVIVLSAIAVGLVWLFWPSGPPRVPFDGLTQEAMLVDKYTSCPNGDGSDMRAYQLRKLDAAAWVAEQNRKGTKWLRGPLTDKRHLKALDWLESCLFGELSSEFQIKRWTASKHAYFYLESYKEFTERATRGDMHYAGVWILDGEKSRLYYLDYSQ